MSLEKFIKSKAVTISTTGTVKEAANLMYTHHIGTVVVVDKTKSLKEIPVGIITDRDIALAYGKMPKLAPDYPIKNVMTRNVVLCGPDDGVYQTITKMRQNGVRRMPVVDKLDQLVGVITSDDLLMLIGEELNDLSQILASETNNEKNIKNPLTKGAQLRSIL